MAGQRATRLGVLHRWMVARVRGKPSIAERAWALDLVNGMAPVLRYKDARRNHFFACFSSKGGFILATELSVNSNRGPLHHISALHNGPRGLGNAGARRIVLDNQAGEEQATKEHCSNPRKPSGRRWLSRHRYQLA